MPRKIPLPRAWNRRTKAAILQILALSHHSFTALVARARVRRSGCDSGPECSFCRPSGLDGRGSFEDSRTVRRESGRLASEACDRRCSRGTV